MNNKEQTINSQLDYLGPELAGTSGEWVLPLSNDRPDLVVTGKYLGIGSTRANYHIIRDQSTGKYVPHEGETARVGEKCRACRWFEIRLFRISHPETKHKTYLIYAVGRSIVPGEVQHCRVNYVRTHYEVLEVLAVQSRRSMQSNQRRNNNNNTSNNASAPKISLTLPVKMMLAQAAAYDEGIEDAYVNRVDAL